MFIEELQPLLEEFARQPAAFVGGFMSGILRLSPGDEPLKTWLNSQGVATSPIGAATTTDAPPPPPAGGPQSIDIE